MTLYNTVFSKNPSAELLIALLGLKIPKETKVEDCFVRKFTRGPELNLITEIVSNRQKVMLGVDEGYITLVLKQKTGGDPLKSPLSRSIYFVDWEQDTKLREFFYLDYRIPAKFRKALAPFQFSGYYKAKERFPGLATAAQGSEAYTDSFTEFHLLIERDLKDAIEAVLADKKPTKLSVVQKIKAALGKTVN